MWMKGKQRKFISLLAVSVISICIMHYYVAPVSRHSNSNANHDTVAGIPNFRGLQNVSHPRTEDPELPVSTDVQKIVFYLWCPLPQRENHFTFSHYLSVKSANLFLRPERIVMFYVDSLPVVDKMGYNTWFDKLREDLHHLVTTRLPSASRTMCTTPADTWKLMESVLLKQEGGGIYTSLETVFTSYTNLFRGGFIYNMDLDGRGYIVVDAATTATSLHSNSRRIMEACRPSQKMLKRYVKDEYKNHCLYFEISRLYPKDFWNRNDEASSVVNYIMYGTHTTPKPVPSAESLVPNIGHMMWVGGGGMSLFFYLSCMSFINVVEVDTLYIHGNIQPYGKYWTKLMNTKSVKFIRIILPNLVYGNTIKNAQTMSDLFRVEVMLKYGGIYSDVDVIWTQKPEPKFFEFDAVASFDWAHAYYPFPEYINLGVCMGKPNAPFWNHLLKSMKDFREDVFGYNGLLKVYKVYEQNPELLQIDRHLQVMCLDRKCHPTWGVPEAEVDWRVDTFAFHWTYPTPSEFRGWNELFISNTTWAMIGRNALLSKRDNTT